ncbi:hypothetical protein [Alphaentomopoxvirus acuprea]|uniref:Uncharacterized protein n=1 Tax=Alphaentomopoxvirus acuprea TaxID=62099 RepID=W6JLI5_9POXV|nr:hypothetical protein BA82_gp121 [Anomala cuprea entomopoxvirus]BAO49481.1 hypothetical protein [Anomala cuprea entomopoxvirus]
MNTWNIMILLNIQMEKLNNSDSLFIEQYCTQLNISNYKQKKMLNYLGIIPLISFGKYNEYRSKI